MKNKAIKLLLSLTLVLFSGCRSLTPNTTPKPVLDAKNVTWTKNSYPVVIIGGGVSGLTASLYLAQADIPNLVIEGPHPGGQLAKSYEVRNWLGQKKVNGFELLEDSRDQVLAAGSEIISDTVTKIDFSAWPYKLTLESNKTIIALSVVIAMGTTPRLLQVPGEDKLWEKSISNCTTCDGWRYRGKHIAIVGGGDAAMEHVAYMSGIADTITLLVRGDTLRAQGTRADQVKTLPNVTIEYNKAISSYSGDADTIESVSISDTATKQMSEKSFDGVFYGIGSTPNSQIFKDLLTVDSDGYITVSEEQKTSLPGVFAIGDIATSDKEYKQAHTAASSGVKAVHHLRQFLEETMGSRYSSEIIGGSYKSKIINDKHKQA